MQFQECLPEACGEGRCRLCDTALCSGKLSGKAGQEIVLCLFRSQDGYRRKYAERVCGQEDDFLRCRSRGYRADDLFNVVDRVRYTCILGHALIVEVDLAVLIQCYVLKQGVALDRVVDIRLRFFIQVDDLRIAATFEVEDAVVIPAVLVITDEETLRVCGKRCLACSGKTEEDRGIFAVHICISGAVHGSDALQRQVVVHHGEHTLLHLSAVPCVQDDLLAACDIEYCCCLRIQA